jgi:hypothetical protein
MEPIGQLAAGIAHEITAAIHSIGDNTRFIKDAFGHLNNVLQKQGGLLKAVRTKTVTDESLSQVESAIQTAELEYVAREIPNAIEQSLECVERVAKILCAMKEFSHSGTAEKTRLDLNHAIESTVEPNKLPI